MEIKEMSLTEQQDRTTLKIELTGSDKEVRAIASSLLGSLSLRVDEDVQDENKKLKDENKKLKDELKDHKRLR